MSVNRVSRETPSHGVPSFDHRVTQCKSTVIFSLGKLRNDFQSHRRKTFLPSSMTNSHLSRGTCAVGPADKTGKSVVRYCPDGNLTSAALRRPEKPSEMIAITNSPINVLNPITTMQTKCQRVSAKPHRHRQCKRALSARKGALHPTLVGTYFGSLSRSIG